MKDITQLDSFGSQIVSSFCICLMIGVLVGGILGCSNTSNVDKAVIGATVAVAASLQAAQLAQNKKAKGASSGECCMVCEACMYPCGDVCVPYGSFCAAATGCACLPETDVQKEKPQQENNPITCNQFGVVQANTN